MPLLRQPVADSDYRVVVGADADAMLAAGYRPVGRKILPGVSCIRKAKEYTLAPTAQNRQRLCRLCFPRRTRCHAGAGFGAARPYHDAMAQDADGQITDPFNGRRDLQFGLLRHVSPAFARRAGAHFTHRPLLPPATDLPVAPETPAIDAQYRHGRRRSRCARGRACVQDWPKG